MVPMVRDHARDADGERAEKERECHRCGAPLPASRRPSQRRQPDPQRDTRRGEEQLFMRERRRRRRQARADEASAPPPNPPSPEPKRGQEHHQQGEEGRNRMGQLRAADVDRQGQRGVEQRRQPGCPESTPDVQSESDEPRKREDQGDVEAIEPRVQLLDRVVFEAKDIDRRGEERQHHRPVDGATAAEAVDLLTFAPRLRQVRVVNDVAAVESALVELPKAHGEGRGQQEADGQQAQHDAGTLAAKLGARHVRSGHIARGYRQRARR